MLTQVFAFNRKENLFKFFQMSYKYFFFYFFNLFKKNKLRRRFFKRPFVYRIDLMRPRFVRKRMKWRFVTLRLVKFYYSLLSYKQFRRIARLAKKRDGLYENNYVLALEGRLVNFLFRTSLVEIFLSLFFMLKVVLLLLLKNNNICKSKM